MAFLSDLTMGVCTSILWSEYVEPFPLATPPDPVHGLSNLRSRHDLVISHFLFYLFRMFVRIAVATIFEKLEHIETKYDELTQQLSSPEVHNDSGRFQKLAKTHADMAEMVAKYREWKEIEKGLLGTQQLLVEAEDAEMKQMAHDEARELEARRVNVERDLKFLMLPKDPNDDKNVIVEIRAGTGGDEASLFAGELFRMYSRYAESQGWKVEVL